MMEAILRRYNSCAAGERFEVVLKACPAGLKIGLLEAGALYQAARLDDGAWRLTVERRDAPAQGSMPGLHHLLSGRDGSLWTCERSHRVARVDMEEKRVAAVRSVALRASHLALDERAGRVFVADAAAGEIIALRADDLAELARWPAPGMPQLPLVSEEGIVCVTGGATGTVTLAWPRGDGYRASSVDVGGAPHDPCLDRDGEHLFVPCAADGSLVKLRLADGKIAGKITVGDGPSHLAMHPDGTRLYSANSWDGSVSCVSVEGERIGDAPSGAGAHAIDISPDGRRVYVANFMDDTLAVFDAATLERLALLPTEAYAHGLDVSPDGAYVVATGFASDHLRIFDAASARELGRVEVGRGSSHTAYGPDGSAWVGCSVSDHLARVDLASLTCAQLLRL
jgi:YVTN family beta-propeller protein